MLLDGGLEVQTRSGLLADYVFPALSYLCAVSNLRTVFHTANQKRAMESKALSSTRSKTEYSLCTPKERSDIPKHQQTAGLKGVLARQDRSLILSRMLV